MKMNFSLVLFLIISGYSMAQKPEVSTEFNKKTAVGNQDKHMSPMLEKAITNGSSIIVKRAIKEGCSLVAPNKASGLNAYELAAYQGKKEILELLVVSGPYISGKQRERMALCADKRLAEIQRLIPESFPLKPRYINGFHELIGYLNPQKPNSLYSHTRKMNREFIASAHNTAAALKALNQGANPNALLEDGNRIILLALIAQNSSLMKMLCHAGAYTSPKIRLPFNAYTTPLILALENDQEENVRTLLAHHADVEQRDSRGLNPLYVSFKKDPRFTRALLARGANPNAKIVRGGKSFSMRQCAIRQGTPEHVQALREYGVRKKRVVQETIY